jgi:hypothetical protein
MRASFSLVSACLLLSAATLARAQSSVQLTNIVEADGTVKALHEGQAVVTTKFFAFLNDWSYIRNWITTGNGQSSFARRGDLTPGIVDAITQVANSATGSDLTITATPNRQITVDSAHVNMMFDEAFWAGAVISDGSKAVTFEKDFRRGFATSGIGQVITVSKPNGFQLKITSPNAVRWTIQDSRQYHLGFELRLDERWGDWPMLVSNVFRAKLLYTNATATLPDREVTIADNAEWHPITPSSNVVQGSALDWSSTRPAAGGRGWLTVNDSGRFAFPGSMNSPEKFYGVNLSHYACFPNRTEAQTLVAYLARMGYNTVRMHHVDYVLVRQSADSTTLDPDMLDRLNFLVSELKKNGFYISLDLHSLRTQKTNEILPGDVNENEYKALLLVSDAARQNYLRFASNLLNSHNPYTGLKWKDEPAIAWMSIDNENSPYWFTNPRPDIKAMLDAAVGDWQPWTHDGSRAAVQLINQVQTYLMSQLRQMGVKSLITSLNGGFNRVLSLGRVNLDFVDNHLYYAHPDGLFVPLIQKNSSPLRKPEEIGWFAASRIAGKPFTVSEWDAVAPNQFRAEFALMVGAMGVIQKWDGMWRFQYTDNMDKVLGIKPMGLFSVVTDPIAMATERAIVALYLRNDLTSNDEPYYVANPLSTANQEEIRDEPIVRQSVLAKAIAQVDSNSSSGNGIVYDGNSLNEEQTVQADFNELSLRIRTNRTAAIVGAQGTAHAAGPLQVTFTKSRASVYATSLDGASLTTSKRILVAHLTDVQNTGARFSGLERQKLLNWGNLPHLIKDGSARVSLQLANPRWYKAYRLDLTGKRVASVSLSRTSSGIHFTVSTSNPNGGTGCIYYELVSR